MSSDHGGKSRPLKKPKVDKKEYDEGMNRVWHALETMTRIMQSNLTAAENTRSGRIEQLTRFRKFSLPPFKGGSDMLEADNWIRSLERIFNILQCSDEERVAFAILMLKDAAYDWWRVTRPSADDDDDHLTWVKFVELFNQRYLPESSQREKEEEFIKLVQGNMSVAEYSNKFNQLARFVKHIDSDSYFKAWKYEEGLRFDIKSQICPLMLKTYTDVLDRAMIVESFSEEYRRRRQYRV